MTKLSNYNGKANCGERRVGGAHVKVRYLCTCDLAEMPSTALELGGTEPGDDFLYDEPFDFSTAEVGGGYWREADAIVDEVEIKNIVEGSKQSTGIANTLAVMIPGAGPAHSEFVQSVVDFSGCLIMMVKLRSGQYAVIGSVDAPCFIEQSEGTIGKVVSDVVGTTLNLRSDSGHVAKYYNADDHGINVTPKAA